MRTRFALALMLLQILAEMYVIVRYAQYAAQHDMLTKANSLFVAIVFLFVLQEIINPPIPTKVAANLALIGILVYMASELRNDPEENADDVLFIVYAIAFINFVLATDYTNTRSTP